MAICTPTGFSMRGLRCYDTAGTPREIATGKAVEDNVTQQGEKKSTYTHTIAWDGLVYS